MYESVKVMDWLLDSDPALRWQVRRNLTEASGPEVAAERSRVGLSDPAPLARVGHRSRRRSGAEGHRPGERQLPVGEEYLLQRRLCRRLSTGEVVDADWLRFSFPTQWHYDVLRGLDYFRAAGGGPDARLGEAIDRRHAGAAPGRA